MTASARPLVDIRAQCACGRVWVHFAGAVRAMFMCSCEDCQRATGTGHSCVVLATRDDVAITGKTASFAAVADSGASFERHFCPNCGTPIFGRSSRAPALIMLPAGLFGAAAGWYVPGQLIFARSHRHWDVLPEGLPRHDTYRQKGALS